MATEIERRFLIANDDWRGAVTMSESYQDGLISRFHGGKLRVRLAPKRAWITIKGDRNGFSRAEFEYEIPVADAKEMLATLCTDPVVEKTRHCVPYGGLIWSVDVHSGRLDGLIFAEVELASEDQNPAMPSWIGKEITHDPRFKKEALLRDWVLSPPTETQTGEPV